MAAMVEAESTNLRRTITMHPATNACTQTQWHTVHHMDLTVAITTKTAQRKDRITNPKQLRMTAKMDVVLIAISFLTHDGVGRHISL